MILRTGCYSQPHFKILVRVWQKPRTTFKQNQLSGVERVKTRDSTRKGEFKGNRTGDGIWSRATITFYELVNGASTTKNLRSVS